MVCCAYISIDGDAMILSDFDIFGQIESGRLTIKPFEKETVRENGMDFRLANEIAHHVDHGKDFVLDPTDSEHVAETYKVTKNARNLIISPGEQVLLSTKEEIGMPDDLVGFVELRSTWARHGLSMPPTIIDAGFHGTITLEVSNNAPYKIRLNPSTRFAHIIFIKTNSKVAGAYKGRYQGQKGIKLPRLLDKSGA